MNLLYGVDDYTNHLNIVCFDSKGPLYMFCTQANKYSIVAAIVHRNPILARDVITIHNASNYWLMLFYICYLNLSI